MEISISGAGLLCAIPKLIPQHLRRVIKLIVLLLTAVCINVSAHSFSQKVSFSGKNVPLTAVFASIEKQTGLSFFFNYQLIRDQVVTANFRNLPLEEALGEVLKGKSLDFYEAGKTVFIVRRLTSAAHDTSVGQTLASRQLNLKGTVTNQQGSPLEGASITLKHEIKGTITDEKGMFELKNIKSDAILEVSFTGYKQQEIRVNGNSFIAIQLSIADSKLDEAQVIAYGNTTQRLSTGDVTNVSSAVIEKQPVNNPLLALEGRVPGLFITQANGLPGSAITIQIQGQNSIQNGNDPFYVIDGVPYNSELLPNWSATNGPLGASTSRGASLAWGGNPFTYINPSDIESISVLKDADATAIYGTRAANGAIIITTKKGRAGETKLDINFQQGWGHVPRKLNLLTTPQYLEMRHEALSNDGLTPSLSNGDYDLLAWDTTRNTDWQKKLIGGSAAYTHANATISGGNSNTQFLVGGTYHRETNVFPGSFADQKGSLHFNINNVSTNQKFHLQLSGNYLVDYNQLPTVDLTASAITLPPDAPPLYNKDGSLNWMTNASGVSTFYSNPVAYTYETYLNKATNLVGNALLSYQLSKGLIIRSSFGYNNMQINETVTFPLTSVIPFLQPYIPRVGYFTNNNTKSWIIEPQLNYQMVIGKGNLEVLGGATFQQNNNNGQQLLGAGYNSDLVISDIGSAAQVSVQSSLATVYKYEALFGRIMYNWDDKYLINLTGRRDGTSRFGPANRFHDFGAVGIGWVFSNESLIRDNISFLSFGKLRGSYGTTGSDQIGDYQFLSQYRLAPAQVPYQGATGLQPSGLSNSYLQWEETKKEEVGLDLGFFKDAVLLNATYFKNQSSNQLLPYKLPVITGFATITRNFPATVQNTGYEFSLNTINIKHRDFSWTTHVNLTFPRNKLVAFPNLASSSYAKTLIVGKPITIVQAYHYLGVNDTTGIYEFNSLKGIPVNTPVNGMDNYLALNVDPTLYGGFSNTFRYKTLSLDIFFQFVRQKGHNYYFGSGEPGVSNNNEPAWTINRWQIQGDVRPIQKFNSNYSIFGPWIDASFSDRAYTDASYIRLKNLALSWSFPPQWNKKAHLQNTRIFIQGQNLFTITHYVGLDPETLSSTTLPPLRTIVAGVQLSL
ncbi:SusC/RagA family TonB-linked outer membrane protein [Puia dinghuensis]|uniref:SusC/RagA family TonB-linked outer membrane protein n=1 Tax=Puia dinghuensis TaxID=1792502 RepID=A0A8J2UJ35_9BACT|nr:SusC/RagA family TonB-linked outer membrane protein [Puia dinghuensis]GGB24021.1 SusC/RagA family TonB-linked outer membrane protein [Puia dinghuensis]